MKKIDEIQNRVTLHCVSNFLFVDMGVESKVFDITDKEQPRLLGTFSLPNNGYLKSLLIDYKNWFFFNVGYQGTYLINKNSLFPIKATPDTCLKLQHYKDEFFIGASGGAGGKIFQLTSIGELQLVSTLSQELIDFIIYKNYLFGACLNSGFKAFDLSNINKPKLLSEPLGNFLCTALDIYNDNSVLIKNEMNEIYIVDISNPSAPQLLSSVKGRFYPYKNYFINYPFLIVRMADPNHVIRVFDCSKTDNPQPIFTYSAPHIDYIINKNSFIVGWGRPKPSQSRMSKIALTSTKVPFEILKISTRGELEKVISIENMEEVYTATIAEDHIYIAKSDGIFVMPLNNG